MLMSIKKEVTNIIEKKKLNTALFEANGGTEMGIKKTL
jgi:hypothetical protein